MANAVTRLRPAGKRREPTKGAQASTPPAGEPTNGHRAATLPAQELAPAELPERRRSRSLHEAAHKLGPRERSGAATAVHGTLNEAAHKLGHAPERSARPQPADDTWAATQLDDERDVKAHAGRVALALGALGVVYGDIGTSPLYAERVIF